MSKAGKSRPHENITGLLEHRATLVGAATRAQGIFEAAYKIDAPDAPQKEDDLQDALGLIDQVD